MPFASPRGRVAVATAVALLAGVVTAWVIRPGASSAPEVPLDLSSSGPAQSPLRALPPESPTPLIQAPPGTAAPAPVLTPTRLEIPSIRVRMPVTPVALDRHGDMELPPSPKLAGWYRFGPAPGSHSGAVVLAAHVDTPPDGIGPLAALEELEAGAPLVVRAGDTAFRYRVVSVRRIDKGKLDLDSLFARDGPPRLHIVTCGGEFDRRTRQYEDNVVALAVPE